LEVRNIGAAFGRGLIRHQQQELAGVTLLTNDASTGCLLVNRSEEEQQGRLFRQFRRKNRRSSVLPDIRPTAPLQRL
jgi:hypothetical protein